MKEELLNILSCGQFLTEREIQKIINSDFPLEEIHHELKQLEFQNLITHYFFNNRYYWISKQQRQIGKLGKIAHQYLTSRKQAQKLHIARTCYHHIGGQLGVTIFTNFYNSNKIFVSKLNNIFLTDKGKRFLSTTLKLPIPNHIKICVDFSERQPHFAGRLGSDLLENFIKLNQITHSTNRVLKINNPKVYDFGK